MIKYYLLGFILSMTHCRSTTKKIILPKPHLKEKFVKVAERVAKKNAHHNAAKKIKKAVNRYLKNNKQIPTQYKKILLDLNKMPTEDLAQSLTNPSLVKELVKLKSPKGAQKMDLEKIETALSKNSYGDGKAELWGEAIVPGDGPVVAMEINMQQQIVESDGLGLTEDDSDSGFFSTVGSIGPSFVAGAAAGYFGIKYYNVQQINKQIKTDSVDFESNGIPEELKHLDTKEEFRTVLDPPGHMSRVFGEKYELVYSTNKGDLSGELSRSYSSIVYTVREKATGNILVAKFQNDSDLGRLTQRFGMSPRLSSRLLEDLEAARIVNHYSEPNTKIHLQVEDGFLIKNYVAGPNLTDFSAVMFRNEPHVVEARNAYRAFLLDMAHNKVVLDGINADSLVYNSAIKKWALVDAGTKVKKYATASEALSAIKKANFHLDRNGLNKKVNFKEINSFMDGLQLDQYQKPKGWVEKADYLTQSSPVHRNTIGVKKGAAIVMLFGLGASILHGLDVADDGSTAELLGTIESAISNASN